MKRTLIAVAALALAAGCKSSNTSGSSGSSTAGSNAGSSNGGGSSGSNAGSTSSGTTGLTGGTTGLSASTSAGSGSNGSTGANGSGSGGSSGTAPANDLCTDAIALTPHTPGDPDQTVQGDTTNANDDFESNNCGGLGGDVFYALHLDQDATVSITMTAGTAGNTVVPSIAQDCSRSELVCHDATDTSTITRGLTAGDYVVVADDYSGEEGPFTLTVSLSAYVPPPPGDVCASPATLTDTDGGYFTASGDNSTYADDFTSNCGGSGPDVFYALHLDGEASVTATATPTSADGGLEPVVSILSGCDSSASQVCKEASGVGASATVTAPRLTGPGDYLVVVDGYSGSMGPFDLAVQLGAPIPPPANDNCEGTPAPITLADPGDGGLLGTAAFDLIPGVTANDSRSDEAGNCFGDGYGPDLVYAITLPSGAPSLTATVIPADGGGLDPFNAVLYLRSPCFDSFDAGNAGSELTCNEGGTLTTGPLDGGTYFLWLDSYSDSSGAGTLQVTVP